ncbi:hypothetical protein EV368DRAFT_66546 [Lentinula lateritia]|uniref:Uncharacterized protein n=1 Tax=Lentinula aff. lateritia TaxID=2804960 RepID=A0ACC1TQ23_9AGAR|nr:hypothetical protein F5876DRAFT_80354 [Lentinula aff. lateritia]KAJ3850507.1 hypothetical protein EV368DRAFT_66546 [Lentinula lateritia]
MSVILRIKVPLILGLLFYVVAIVALPFSPPVQNSGSSQNAELMTVGEIRRRFNHPSVFGPNPSALSRNAHARSPPRMKVHVTLPSVRLEWRPSDLLGIDDYPKYAKERITEMVQAKYGPDTKIDFAKDRHAEYYRCPFNLEVSEKKVFWGSASKVTGFFEMEKVPREDPKSIKVTGWLKQDGKKILDYEYPNHLPRIDLSSPINLEEILQPSPSPRPTAP